MNIWAIFLTGLTTGGLSCVAMQGGLLTSVIANQKESELDEKKSNTSPKSFDVLDWLPVLMFLGAKLIAHVILGAFLGALGTVLTLNLTTRLVFQILTSLFMFATAMNLLEVHPIFRYVVFQPPKFIQRLIKNTAKGKALFTPAILGFFTVFIPCGVTQAMEVVAINTGNPLYGALIMGAFIVGTMPLFALIGVATAKLSEIWNTQFLQFAALALLIMAIAGLNGVLTVIDSPITFQKIGQIISSLGEPPDWYGNSVGQVTQEDGTQSVTITIASNGYSPKEFTVKAGSPVSLTLKSNGAYTCATAFTFKKFNIFVQLKPNDVQTIVFTPKEKGDFTFSCSMGMYSGVMHVI